jgi:hypothetical protein
VLHLRRDPVREAGEESSARARLTLALQSHIKIHIIR